MAIRRRIPASIRHLNSGAQYPGPVARQFGSTGFSVIGGGHKIATFPDALSGAAAHFALLRQKYSGMSLESGIRKWSGGNGTRAYVRNVSRASGIRPDEILTPQVLASDRGLAMVRAMAAHEAGGVRYPLDDAGWRQAQQVGLGSREQFEALRQAQVQGSMQRGSVAEVGQQAPNLGVVDPSNPDAPSRDPRISPEGLDQRISPIGPAPLQSAPVAESGAVGRGGSGGLPSWATAAFDRAGNQPVDPVTASAPISPFGNVPPPPPAWKIHRLGLGRRS